MAAFIHRPALSSKFIPAHSGPARPNARHSLCNSIRLPLSLPPTLSAHVILKEHYVLAYAAEDKDKSLETLLQKPLLIFPRDKAPEMFDDIMSIFKTYNVQPKILHEASEQFTLLGMAQARLGIVITPKSAALNHLENVVCLELPDPSPRTSLALIYEKNSNAVVQNFLMAQGAPKS